MSPICSVLCLLVLCGGVYAEASYQVRWYAPFFAHSGFGSEAAAYVVPLLEAFKASARGEDAGIVNFALPQELNYINGLTQRYRSSLEELSKNGRMDKAGALKIVVCHSTPDYWFPSAFAGWDSTAPCPPKGDNVYAVGRTMYETDRFPNSWFDKYQQFQELWVPTHFHLAALVKSGRLGSQLVKVVPQSVDTDLFKMSTRATDEDTFKFLSVFKWEDRKGWDVLLRAFLLEFDPEKDDVELVIKTSEFHLSESIMTSVEKFAAKENLPLQGARLSILQDELTSADVAALYNEHDAFVISSRGEGWCRPLAEAMSSGLPAIATNFSGMTEFMTDENSYPLRVERMLPVPNNKEGHMWADPSVPHLRKLMRFISANREEAQKVGQNARRTMVERYSFASLTQTLIQHFERISAKHSSDSKEL